MLVLLRMCRAPAGILHMLLNVCVLSRSAAWRGAAHSKLARRVCFAVVFTPDRTLPRGGRDPHNSGTGHHAWASASHQLLIHHKGQAPADGIGTSVLVQGSWQATPLGLHRQECSGMATMNRLHNNLPSPFTAQQQLLWSKAHEEAAADLSLGWLLLARLRGGEWKASAVVCCFYLVRPLRRRDTITGRPSPPRLAFTRNPSPWLPCPTSLMH